MKRRSRTIRRGTIRLVFLERIVTRANRDLELGDNEPSQDHAYPTTRVGGVCLARVLFNCTVSRRNLRVRLRGTIAHAIPQPI